MLSKSTVERDFLALRAMDDAIEVPWVLWLPDEDAVAYAWLGGVGRRVFGKRTRRLRGGLEPARFHGLLSRSPMGRNREAGRWVHALPELSPAQLWTFIRAGLDFGPLAVRTEVLPHHHFDLTFAFADRGSEHALALGQRVFSLSERVVEHKWLRVVEPGRAIAAHVINALLPMYESLGIYTVRITAGLSAGGAVWAKFGFVPDPADWIVVAGTITANVNAVLTQSNILPADVREACEASLWLAKQADPKNLWIISDLGRASLEGVRLGTYLLRNVRWKGSLNFADSEAVNRLSDRFQASDVSLTALKSLSIAASRERRND